MTTESTSAFVALFKTSPVSFLKFKISTSSTDLVFKNLLTSSVASWFNFSRTSFVGVVLFNSWYPFILFALTDSIAVVIWDF